MIQELITFLERLFPSIDPYTAQGAKDALRQFSESGRTSRMLAEPLDADYQQGDIFSLVPFVEIADDGMARVISARGMLLTNSCDCTRNGNLHFAAMLPISEYTDDASKVAALKKNEAYQFLYLPDEDLADHFVDFGLITSVSREAFNNFVNCGKSVRLHTLSQIGYFILISKLTVFFMRPEDPDVYSSRCYD